MSQHKVRRVLTWLLPLGPPHLTWVPPLRLPQPLHAPLGQAPQPIPCPSSRPTLSSRPSKASMSDLQPGVCALLMGPLQATTLQQGVLGTNPLTPAHQQPTLTICHFALVVGLPAVTGEGGSEACCTSSTSSATARPHGNQTARNAEDASGLPGMLCLCTLNIHVAGCCSCC